MSTKSAKNKDASARELTDKRIKAMKSGCQCDCLQGWPKLNENEKPFTRIFYKSTGMFIEISKTNRKVFRYTYRNSEGKQTLVTIGRFDEDGDGANNFNLAQAEAIYNLAIDKLKQQNIDPKKAEDAKKEALEKKDEQNQTTFKSILPEWFDYEKFVPSHQKKVERRINKFCGALMDKSIHRIAEEDLRSILSVVAKDKKDAARRLYASLRQIFEYAKIERKLLTTDPMGGIYSKEFPAVTTKSFNHSLGYPTLKKILNLVKNNNTGGIQTYTALRIAPYLFVRPTELRLMRWSDIDFARRIWGTRKAKVIGREVASDETQNLPFDFFVPLPQQVIDLLKELEAIKTCDYVFSLDGQSPPSDSTFSKALRELLKANNLARAQTVHGFRHVFRSFAESKLKISDRVIEQQMSHKETPKSSDKQRYDQNLMIPERQALMDVYADFLDGIRDVFREYAQGELAQGEETPFSKLIDGLILEYPEKVRYYEQVTKFD